MSKNSKAEIIKVILEVDNCKGTTIARYKGFLSQLQIKGSDAKELRTKLHQKLHYVLDQCTDSIIMMDFFEDQFRKAEEDKKQ